MMSFEVSSTTQWAEGWNYRKSDQFKNLKGIKNINLYILKYTKLKTVCQKLDSFLFGRGSNLAVAQYFKANP